MKKSLIMLALAAILCSMAGCQSAEEKPVHSDSTATTSSVATTVENTTTESMTTTATQTTTEKKATTTTKKKAPATTQKKKPAVPDRKPGTPTKKPTTPSKKPTTTKKPTTPPTAPITTGANGKYATMKDYAESPEMRQEEEQANKELVSENMRVSVKGKGDTLIFTYTFTVLPDVPNLKQQLKDDMEGSRDAFEALAASYTDKVNVKRPVVVIHFMAPDGSELASGVFKAP